MTKRAADGERGAGEVFADMIRIVDEALAKNKNLLPQTVRRLEELREDLWDAQIEEDSKSGALDAVSEKAMAQHANGESGLLHPPPGAKKRAR